MSWFFYFASCFGLAYIVGHSKISFPIRVILGGLRPTFQTENGEIVSRTPGRPSKLGKPGEWLCALLECPACFGVWEGTIAAWLFVPSPLPIAHWCWIFILACATSAVNLILAKYAGLLE